MTKDSDREPLGRGARRTQPRHVGSVGVRNRFSRRYKERGIVFGAGAPCPLPVGFPVPAGRRLPAGVSHRGQASRPKLGIDLQGGTRVTLTARTPDGSRPSRDALAQAQQIISARVNGLGVSGSEVVVDGDNLVITVPGNDGSEARNLGQTARLYIRPVLNSMPAPRPPNPSPQPSSPPAPPPGSRRARRPGGAGARRRTRAAGQPRRPRRPPVSRRPPAGRPAPQPRPYPQDPPPAPSPAPARRRPRDAPATGAPAGRAAAAGRRRLRRPRRRIRARISPSASPTRRSGGRAPVRAFSSWRCSSRPPAATKTTSWPATTTRRCPW